MMRTSVQIDDIRLLDEALSSQCDGLRLGSEFCEVLLPDVDTLERAYELVRSAGKEFTYVTPRLSNTGIKQLENQLPFLSEQEGVRVVVNDFGALRVLRHCPCLSLRLGRHLIMVRARSPWAEMHIRGEAPSSERRRWVQNLYSTTSLNYQPTVELYRRFGCQGADVDWLPSIFPALGFLAGNGLSLSVLLQLVPVTFTRRCHTARFLGEKSPADCNKPCQHDAFLLRNEMLEELGLEFFLQGNAVFRLVQPSREDVAELERQEVSEIVLTMNPLTGIDTAEKINELMASLEP
jgi:hypothetical protein